MKDGPETSADSILATLSIVYQESIEKEKQVSAEEELDELDMEELPVDESAKAPTATSGKRSSGEKFAKKTGRRRYGR